MLLILFYFYFYYFDKRKFERKGLLVYLCHYYFRFKSYPTRVPITEAVRKVYSCERPLPASPFSIKKIQIYLRKCTF